MEFILVYLFITGIDLVGLIVTTHLLNKEGCTYHNEMSFPLGCFIPILHCILTLSYLLSLTTLLNPNLKSAYIQRGLEQNIFTLLEDR